MDKPSRIRRCHVLRLRLVEHVTVDWAVLLSGGEPVRRQTVIEALAPHLDQAVEIDEDLIPVLVGIDATDWVSLQIATPAVDQLLANGLLLNENDTSPHATRDRVLRETLWHAEAAVTHAFSRWSHTDSVVAQRESRKHTVEDMVEACGPPPPHFYHRDDAITRITLKNPVHTDLDDLLERRATCRNYDLSQPLQLAQLSALLKRVFGVNGMEELAPGAVALKKNHPSGGALHPTEAYLVVQRVERLQPGLYHYNVEAHALDLLRGLSVDEARELAMTAVAGQDYFADAPVMVVMAARFARSMWKYRNHPKIYRAILLEMGHISQNLYLTATEMDLGAFITAAINEVEIEKAFGLEPMAEGPLAVCGFGARARERVTVEFDPGHKVWSDA